MKKLVLLQMVFLNRFGKDEKSVGVIASPAMEDLLRKRMGKYDGVNVKVTDVNVEDMVKKTLPVSQESLSKREEEDFNYLQYEPLSKVLQVSYYHCHPWTELTINRFALSAMISAGGHVPKIEIKRNFERLCHPLTGLTMNCFVSGSVISAEGHAP